MNGSIIFVNRDPIPTDVHSLMYCMVSIGRDFSNGFLVAEIFSRYFPREIKMHSYDYGTKNEKKTDNWAQLQKFFKKISFMILKDEVETIVKCQTPDGAGPLLERMYKFLTLKRSKPEEGKIEKQERQHQQNSTVNSESAKMSSAPVSARMDICKLSRDTHIESNRINMPNETCSTISAPSNVDERASVLVCSCIKQGKSPGSPCLSFNCQHFIYENNSFHPIQREAADHSPKQENRSGVLLPLQSNISFSDYGECMNQFKGKNDYFPTPLLKRINCKDENHEKVGEKVVLSAVERARQREICENPNFQHKMVDGDHVETTKPSSKTTSNIALAFRSHHRQRKFKQYTLNDYRRQQSAACVQLGKLGPDLEDEELGEKREKLERMKEFGRIVRSCNTAQVNVMKRTKTPPLSKRQKALEFAATVPKPKVKKVEVEKLPTPEKNHHQLSELQILEAKHEADRQHVEAMRRELEIFLR
ncbi:uncharacterized protein [Physcomitrium patens]|uniref:CH-like domain-containing protein n=2 Tax=Physcomitrium patens TaxID=3218 RepID=A0A7I4AFB5_PHYPA|nr:uncharacterized protein LOC112290037 isoform X3 [Physcomitrium patens]|eukprot:XP_024391699.1 uncharacterized protein LOC112290037 isoform X3 [Physcomitrella patens]